MNRCKEYGKAAARRCPICQCDICDDHTERDEYRPFLCQECAGFIFNILATKDISELLLYRGIELTYRPAGQEKGFTTMGDRNEYFREYMRNYRAAKKAAAAVENMSQATASTEPALTGTESTEGGGVPKWVWWLIVGVIVGACVYGCVQMARNAPIDGGQADFSALTNNGQGDETPNNEQQENDGQGDDLTEKE